VARRSGQGDSNSRPLAPEANVETLSSWWVQHFPMSQTTVLQGIWRYLFPSCSHIVGRLQRKNHVLEKEKARTGRRWNRTMPLLR
jgi:hypothetical protein